MSGTDHLDDDFREGWDTLHASSGPAVQFRLSFHAGHPTGDGGHARAPRLVRGRPDRWPAQRARRAGGRCVLHIQSAVARREARGGPRMHPACVRRGTTGPDRSHRRCRSDAVERAPHRTQGRARRPGHLSLVSLRKTAQGARGDRASPLCGRAGDDAVRQARRDVRAPGIDPGARVSERQPACRCPTLLGQRSGVRVGTTRHRQNDDPRPHRQRTAGAGAADPRPVHDQCRIGSGARADRGGP